MMDDKYSFNIPEGGSKSMDVLDYSFNKTTCNFLIKSGLTDGMKILESCHHELPSRLAHLGYLLPLIIV